MIDPTTAMAEIAFVIDMSGVCSRRETRRITPSPMNEASTNTNSCDQNSEVSVMIRGFLSGSGAHRLERVPGSSVPHFAGVRDQRAGLDVVVQVELERPALGKRLYESRQIAREEQAGVDRQGGRQVQRGQDGDAPDDRGLAEARE